MVENKTRYVYELIDPISNMTMYIGCSTDPAYRLKNHYCGGGNEKVMWLRWLRKNKLQPILNIIERVDGDWFTQLNRENYWMLRRRQEGHQLLNVVYRGTNKERKLNACMVSRKNYYLLNRAISKGHDDD